jgi:chromate reductase, NAD(P)H dehydrogenase (quinone)
LEHLGSRVFPDMFSLAQAQLAFAPHGGLLNPVLADRLESTVVAFLDLVEAAKHYPEAKKAWFEFLGERLTPATARADGQGAPALGAPGGGSTTGAAG